MKMLVFLFVAGVLSVSTPAFSQPRTFLGTIAKDRHEDTVADLLEKAGCHKDWQKLAVWNQRSVRKQNWLHRLFSGKPKLPVGTRIYLEVPNLESCKLSPKEFAKAEVMGSAAAETLRRSLEARSTQASSKTDFVAYRTEKPLSQSRSRDKEPRKTPQARVVAKKPAKMAKTIEEPTTTPPPAPRNISANISAAKPMPLPERPHGLGVDMLLMVIGGVVGFFAAYITYEFGKKPPETRIYETQSPKIS